MKRIFEKTGLIQFDPNLPAGKLNFDNIVFLDFDGVLHPEGCDDSMEFMFAKNFCKVMSDVDPEGEVPIVISSMWRFYETIDELRSHLSPAIRRQVVGSTPNLLLASEDSNYGWGSQVCSGVSGGIRQKEIEQWLLEHAPAACWLSIDDREEAFSVDCPDLFLVPAVYDDGGGIDDKQAQLLKERMLRFLGRQKIENILGRPGG